MPAQEVAPEVSILTSFLGSIAVLSLSSIDPLRSIFDLSKKIWQCRDSITRLLSEKRECFLFAMPTIPTSKLTAKTVLTTTTVTTARAHACCQRCQRCQRCQSGTSYARSFRSPSSKNREFKSTFAAKKIVFSILKRDNLFLAPTTFFSKSLSSPIHHLQVIIFWWGEMPRHENKKRILFDSNNWSWFPDSQTSCWKIRV